MCKRKLQAKKSNARHERTSKQQRDGEKKGMQAMKIKYNGLEKNQPKKQNQTKEMKNQQRITNAGKSKGIENKKSRWTGGGTIRC